MSRNGHVLEVRTEPARLGIRHPKLIAVIKLMEENIEEPLSRARLARDADLSTRQLERLFRKYLQRTPTRHYLEIRLNRARLLLQQTDPYVATIFAVVALLFVFVLLVVISTAGSIGRPRRKQS